MKILFYSLIIAFSLCQNILASGRFPTPDFESGYELPPSIVEDQPVALSPLAEYINIAILLITISLASWLAIKKRSRKGLIILTVFAVAYFGFYRQGCICPVGAIGNFTLALFGNNYIIPLSVLLILILPLLFTLFFGRTFCAAVCPLGAIQELTVIKPLKLPRPLNNALSLIAYLYLTLAILFAAMGSLFIICKYDPFVVIFRMTGSKEMVIAAITMLVIGMFIARPYCRFLCPLGVIFNWISRLSRHHLSITPADCINCRLCPDSCPYDAIDAPMKAPTATELARIRKRFFVMLGLSPLMIIIGIILGDLAAETLAQADTHITIAELLREEIANNDYATTDETKAFYRSGQNLEEFYQQANIILQRYNTASRIAGGFMGLIVALKLLSLSIYRSREYYQPNSALCYSCGRCFASCPVEKK